MKTLRSIVLSTITVASLGVTTVAQTDNPPAQTTPASIPLPLLQAAPLVQATSKLLGQQSYEIESTAELIGNLPDRQLAANANIQTIVAAPNQVNSKITFVDRDRNLERQYQIVGDGIQVWIYDGSANKYSVSNYQEFIQSSAGLNVGILANFYLRTLDKVNSNKIASRAIAKLPPERLVKYFQRLANADLQNMTIRNEQLGDTAYSIYDINATDNSYEVTTYVSPESSNIDRIDLVGQQDGLDLLLIEQVSKQNIPPAVAPETFNFTPPDDAELVESPIAIEAF